MRTSASKKKKQPLSVLNCKECPKLKEFSPSDPMVRSDVLKMLSKHKKSGIALVDLAKKLHTSDKNVKAVITYLFQHDGYNVYQGDDKYYLSDVLPPIVPLTVKKLRGKEIKFGLVSDTHLCNQHARLDVLEAAYNMFEEQGVKEVFHAGNIIDGEFKYNRYELYAHGVHDQSNYLADNYPQRKGITTYFITGDCYDDQTEVMVRGKGFILFSEVSKEDEVATLNLETRKWEWQKSNKLIEKDFVGEMLHFSTKRMDYMVTPGHRMFYKKRDSQKIEFCKAEDFPERAEKQTFCGCKWEGSLPKTISVPFIESKNPWAIKNNSNEFPAVPFLRFLGWFISEGWLDDTRISIGQHKKENQEEIKNIIQQLGFELQKSKEDTFSFCSLHLSRYLQPLGKSYQKYIPEELKNLDSSFLLEFLQAYWKGDGHKDFDSGYASTSSKRLASDLVELGMKCGWAVMFSEHQTAGTQGKIFGEVINHNYNEFCIYFNKMTEPWYPKKPEKVSYSGKVYCVQVENGTLLVRRNGRVMWGSNCHEGWFQKDCGLRIGWYIQNWCMDRGRNDLVHIGHLEQDVLFEMPLGTFRMRLIHPGGGTPYAVSYPSQKMVESFQGGDKPQVLVMGHFHKFDISYPREVLTIMPGCTEDQTPFMRKLKLKAEVGFCVCTLGARVDGTLGEFGCKWVPFYDVGYHKKLEGYKLEV